MNFANDPELTRFSTAIAMNEMSGSFDSVGVTPHQNTSALPVSLTNVFTIPGESNPRLHKAHLVVPGMAPAGAEQLLGFCTEYIGRTARRLNDGDARDIAKEVEAACEQLDQDESKMGMPFITIGLLAVYSSPQSPLIYRYTSKQFTDALADQIPELATDPEAIPDAAWEQLYALRSEHGTSAGSLEDFIVSRKLLMAEAAADGGMEMKRQTASEQIGLLLLPHAATHPIFNMRLFDTK